MDLSQTVPISTFPNALRACISRSDGGRSGIAKHIASSVLSNNTGVTRFFGFSVESNRLGAFPAGACIAARGAALEGFLGIRASSAFC